MRPLALLAVVLLTPAALATHDTGCVPGQETWGLPFVDTAPAHDAASPIPRLYIFYEPNLLWFPTATLWIYEESNGLDGLQRGGEDYTTTESCGHPPDTIIW